MEKRKHKNHFWKGALCGALAIFIAGCGAVAAAHFSGLSLVIEQNGGTSVESKLNYLEQLVDKYYLYSDEVTDEVLREGVYAGYIEALGDPYSAYYDEEATKALFQSTSGEFYGIGVAFSQNMNTMITTATMVYDDSPAQEAGIKVNDILYKVDGEDVTARDLSDVVMDIRGEEGTVVEITVLRGDDMEEITMQVTRRKIEVQTVEYEMKEDNIGYIQITEFDTVTCEQFEKAFEELSVQGMEGLIVDLRSNPGGSLATVVDILDVLLPEGLLVYTQDKDGNQTQYKSDDSHQYTDPMVVLVNGYSASASEIFAGAVQDYEAGIIMGTTTYGKGIVQQLITLPDNTCAKLTVSEYFTPDGRNIHGTGIEPDMVVEYEVDEANPETDNQIDAAIKTIKEEIEK